MANAKLWWYTDPDGRRIGWMDPDDFELILSSYYGDENWVNRFTEQFGITKPTIYRYMKGAVPVPKDVAMIVLMLEKYGPKEDLPVPIAPWLPSQDEIDGLAKAG